MLITKDSESWMDIAVPEFMAATATPEKMGMPVPPLGEQRTIADFLDHETAKLDGLTAKIREAIERLRELRLALIAAAVTGKIDVRDSAA